MIRPSWLVIGIGAAVGVVGVLFAKAAGRTALVLPDCSTQFKALARGGVRNTKNLRLIVLHSTEGSTAQGAAGWFANPASKGSTQIVVDNDHCYRTLPDDVVPYGSPGGRTNEDGLHIEFAGFAKWTRAEWMLREAELLKGAAIVKHWCEKYGIPLVFLTAEDLKRDGLKARGITTHVAITDAFKAGSHTDPGKGFPLDWFMSAIGGKAPRGAGVT